MPVEAAAAAAALPSSQLVSSTQQDRDEAGAVAAGAAPWQAGVQAGSIISRTSASYPSSGTNQLSSIVSAQAASRQGLVASGCPSAVMYPAQAACNGADAAAGSPMSLSKVLALVWHPSDAAVKPIVANRRIERLPEPQWDAKSLPFEPLSLQQMLNSDQQELEAFLTHIYRTIASSAPVKDKVNVLSYFESLCSDTAAANVLINSSLTVLFVRMLRNGKTPLLRIRLASVLGLLVRHATYIADELAGTQLVEILTEALRDKNERVRRRCEHGCVCVVCGAGVRVGV